VRTNVKMLAAVAASALGLLGLTASPAMASIAAPSCESGASAVHSGITPQPCFTGPQE
jgi:hypothetical protein